MHATALRLSVFSPAKYQPLTANYWPPFKKSNRVLAAERRSLPTRRANLAFKRYYNQLTARHHKLLLTQSLARLRLA